MTSGQRVAVIIPTYNRWPYVCEAIDSVLGQSHKNTECIVIDDASSDGSCHLIQKKYGNLVNVLSNSRNKEKSYCRNRGVRACDADFLCFLDSDDLLTLDSVRTRLDLFMEDQSFVGVSFGITQRLKQTTDEAFREFDSKVDTSLPLLEQYLVHQGFLTTDGFMISKSNMIRHGMYAEDFTNMEDVELFLRLLCALDFKFCGSIVARTRRIDDSAQSNHKKIIRQGFKLTDCIRMDQKVMSRIGDDGFQKVRSSEYEKFLATLYHAGWYRSYRRYYTGGLRENLTPRRLKFFKRYVLSFLRISAKDQELV